MAAITICSDFGAQKNKVSHCFHCFPIICHEVRFSNKMLVEGWDDEIKGMSLFGVPSRNMKGKCKNSNSHKILKLFFRIWKKEGGAKGKSMQLPKAIGFLLGNILVLSAATGAGTFVSSKSVHASQTQLHAPCQPRGVGLRVWMGGRLKGRGYTHTCNLHCWTAEISTALPFKKF